MRHWLRLALCGGALAALLTCGAAAATTDYTTDVAGTVTYNGDSSYTASYTGAKDGNQYAILVVKGTYENGVPDYSISEDTIMYIDQKAADSSGVSFDFIPRSTPDCVVLLGGDFGTTESPVVLGTLAGKGVTVSGSVDYYNYDTNPWGVNVAVETTAGTQVTNFMTETDGAFTTTIPEDTYHFVVTAKGYLTHTEEVIISADSGEIVISYKSYAGDTDGTGAINPTDLSFLLADINSIDPYRDTDLDNSGAVNVTDLSILLGNLGNVSD